MTGRLRIGVVGCGIAGTSFALMARRDGHAVDLFEQTRHVGPLGAGVLLQPSGQRILDGMGLLAAVTARAEVIHEIHAVTHHGKDLVRFRYDDGAPGAAAFGVHRGDLFTVLHGELEAAGVRLHLGVPIVACETGGDAATLADEDGVIRGPFDLLVIADGGRSRLRQSMRLPHRCREYAHGALWAVGNCDAVRGRLFQVTRGTRRLCGLLPMGQGRCSFFWGCRRDEFAALRDEASWRQWKAEVLALAPAAAELVEALRPPEGLTFTTFRHVLMPDWAHGRAVLIGDAAHATSPHLGQGINLALIDAATLAVCVEAAADVPSALAAYAARRRRQLRYYSFATGLMTPFFQSDGWLWGIGRDLCLPLLPRIGMVRRLMLRTLRGEVYGASGRGRH